KMFHDGAVKVMEAAGIKPAAEPTGVWDTDISATNFEQALTSLGGKVDAVWSANDANAAGVISILDKNGLTVPVSGQDVAARLLASGWWNYNLTKFYDLPFNDPEQFVEGFEALKAAGALTPLPPPRPLIDVLTELGFA
ncbi:MAG: hypothetical protein J0I28_06795, partial [Caulobacterales bacterium]|nr:hypothetical protein [Caulobacterales bacterium]